MTDEQAFERIELVGLCAEELSVAESLEFEEALAHIRARLAHLPPVCPIDGCKKRHCLECGEHEVWCACRQT